MGCGMRKCHCLFLGTKLVPNDATYLQHAHTHHTPHIHIQTLTHTHTHIHTHAHTYTSPPQRLLCTHKIAELAIPVLQSVAHLFVCTQYTLQFQCLNSLPLPHTIHTCAHHTLTQHNQTCILCSYFLAHINLYTHNIYSASTPCLYHIQTILASSIHTQHNHTINSRVFFVFAPYTFTAQST